MNWMNEYLINAERKEINNKKEAEKKKRKKKQIKHTITNKKKTKFR